MPAQKVTGGLLFFYGIGARGLTLQSKNLLVTFDLGDSGSFSLPNGPYPAAAAIKLSGNLTGDQTLHFGPAYYAGTQYATLWYEGSLQFKVAKLLAPAASSQPVTAKTKFTFKATLKAFQANNISGGGGPPVFNVSLTGNGIATAFLGASYPGPNPAAQVRDVLAQSYCFRT
jgi:hypothetical protein